MNKTQQLLPFFPLYRLSTVAAFKSKGKKAQRVENVNAQKKRPSCVCNRSETPPLLAVQLKNPEDDQQKKKNAMSVQFCTARRTQ
jgi:hypothetical protein